MVWARGGSGGGFFWKNGLGGRVLEEDSLEKWSGGHFFPKKNLPQISAWGIFLEKFFLKFLKIFKNFKKNQEKFLKNDFRCRIAVKRIFQEFFLKKILEILENFQEFQENFSRNIPQVGICGRFFLKKNAPQTMFQENPPPEPPPRPFSRNILLQTHPLPRPFFQKKISSRPPPPCQPSPPNPPPLLC